MPYKFLRLNSEDRGLKVRFSLATIAFDRDYQLKCLKYYHRKGKTHLQTPILTIISAFSSLKVRERNISPKFFRPKFFRGRPRGMPVPKCLVFQDLEGLNRSSWPDVPQGRPAENFGLWADFSFLIIIPSYSKLLPF